MEPKSTSMGGSLLVPSVQELAKEALVDVPPRYVRPDQDPTVISWLSSTRPEVPIVDMQRLLSDEFIDYELEKLHLACKDWGFFQVLVYSSTYTYPSRFYFNYSYCILNSTTYIRVTNKILLVYNITCMFVTFLII